MIVATIPTRHHPPTLAPLLATIEGDGIAVVVTESADYHHELHRMWNFGVCMARSMGATEVAILNDDIEIAPGTLAALRDALRHPRYPNAAVVHTDHHLTPTRLTTPLQRKRLLSMPKRSDPRLDFVTNGHCFMLKAELPLPEFDERFHIYYGDRIFYAAVRAAGYDTVRARGVGCIHHAHTSTGLLVAESDPRLDEDALTFATMPAGTLHRHRRTTRLD